MTQCILMDLLSRSKVEMDRLRYVVQAKGKVTTEMETSGQEEFFPGNSREVEPRN